MESEDRKPIFTKRLILTVLAVILIILIILLLLRRCGNGNRNNYNVTGVTVSPLYLTLAPGETGVVYAQVEPSDAKNQTVTWSSSNPSVATVDPYGVVTGVGEGTADITATSEDGGFTATCTVTVTKSPTKLTGIELSSNSYTVKVGKSKLVSVLPTPRDAQLPELTYSIVDESIATVNSNGVIKGVSVGTTTLVVKSVDGQYSTMATVKVVNNPGGGSDDCPAGQEKDKDGNCVTVITQQPKPTKLDISGNKDVTLSVGDIYIIPFRITPDDAAQEAVCSVNDSSILSENDCKITALTKGTTTVKVCAKADPNICDTLKVTVKNPTSPCTGSGCGGQPHTTTEPSGGTETTAGDAVITITPVTTAGNNKWHRSGKFVITVAGNINDISKITYETSDSAGSGNKQSGTLTSGTKTIYLDDTPGTATVVVKYTYNGKEYTVKNSITKIDSKNPVCTSYKYVASLKKITVNASDEMSGLKNAVISGNSVDFTGSNSASYSISKVGKYSVLIYDVAGNSTSCGSIDVTDMSKDADGKTGAIPVKIEASATKVSLALNEYKGITAWVLMSDGTKRQIKSVTCTTLECKITSGLGTTSSVSIKGSAQGSGHKVTLNAADVDSLTITVDVGELTKPYIYYSKPRNGSTVTITGKARNDGEEISTICFGYSYSGAACKATTCKNASGIEASATFDFTVKKDFIGTYTTCGSVKTSKNMEATVGPYNYVNGDTVAPVCTIQSYGNGKYLLTASDEGTGIHKIDGKTYDSKYFNGGTMIVDKTDITVEDRAGNKTKCTVKTGTSTPTGISVKCSPTTLEGKGNTTKCIATVEPETANQKVTWSESSEYIKHDGDGVFSQVKNNETDQNETITVTATTADGKKSATAKLTISPSGLMDFSSSPTCNIYFGQSEIQVGEQTSLNISCVLNGGTRNLYSNYFETTNSTGATISGVRSGGGACTINGKPNACFAITYTVKTDENTTPGTITVNLSPNIFVNKAGHGNSSATARLKINQKTVTADIKGTTQVESKGTAQFTATLTGATATKYEWSSSKTTCATIVGNGATATLTAKENLTDKPCTTTVKATIYYDNNKTKEVTKEVSIKPDADALIKLDVHSSTGNYSISSEESLKFTASLEGTPAMRYEWTSSNTNCATVSGSSSSATVKALKVTSQDCQTTITAKVYYNGGSKYKEDSKVVKVAHVAPQPTITCGNPGMSVNFAFFSISVQNIKAGYKVSYSKLSGQSDLSCVGTSTASSNTLNRGCTTYNNGSYNILVSVTDDTGNVIKNGNCKGNIDFVPEKTVTIRGTDELESNKDAKLSASITYASAKKYEWKSNSPSCVSVSGSTATATIKAVSSTSCTATITATISYDGGSKSATHKVKVIPVTPPSVSIIGSSEVYGGNSLSYRADLKNGTASYYTWTSNKSCASAPGRVTTTSATITTNTVTSNCAATITVRAYDASGNRIATNTKTLTVKPEPSLKITGTTTISTAKGTTLLTANLTNANAASYRWQSSNTGCATASSSLNTVKVTGVNTSSSTCRTTITVWAYDMNSNVIKSTTATVTVAGTTTSTTVHASISASASVDSEKTISLSASLSGAAPMRYEWSSSNINCATVSGSSSSATLRAAKVTKTCSTKVTVTIYYNGGSEIASDTKTITVNPASGEDFNCGTVASRSNSGESWTNKAVTVKINCTGSDCNKPTFEYTWNGTAVVTKGTITISSKTGSTKSCSVTVNYDPIPPRCTYTSTPNSSGWTNQSVRVTAKCTDTGSGCSDSDVSKDMNITGSMEYVNWVVIDKAGNTAKCGSYRVGIDKNAPSLTCTITSNDSTSGVKVKRVFSDSLSGLSSGEAAGASKTLEDTYKYNTTFTAKDKADNTKKCYLNITTKTTKVCPTNYPIALSTTKCRNTTETSPTTCTSGYTYNSSTSKCEKTTTTSKSGTGGPNCNDMSGTCSVSNVNYSGGVFTWKCNCTTTLSPTCKSTQATVSGKCYGMADKVDQKTYSGTISY